MTTALANPGTAPLQHGPNKKAGPSSVTLSMFQLKGDDMGRKRGQREGYLHKKGPSWILQWREDVRTAAGDFQRGKFARVIGPSTMTRKEAEREAWTQVLEKLDRVTIHPRSLATVEEFIRLKFEPDWIWALKPSGQKHYHAMLKRIAPTLGTKRLAEVSSDLIQQMVKSEIEKGRSVQTARHVRNAVSAIFRHAKATGFYYGENPAHAVKLPRMTRREVHALDVDQARAVLTALGQPERAMALLSITTSLNIAELLGLRWKHVNLSGQFSIVGSDPVPPFTLAVRENYYRGDFCSLKKESRKRNVPLAQTALAVLEELKARPRFTGAEDLVFANRKGGALNENNLRKRKLAPAGKAVGLPFALSWHVFRRTAATLAEIVSMPLSDRQAVMGHAGGEMTLKYTRSDTDRRRAGIQSMADLLVRTPTQ